jgi:hypothetical protein
MQFYAYNSHAELGNEPLGTDGKLLFELKTYSGAVRRVQHCFKNTPWNLYTYLNFYDNSTFKLVQRSN